MSTVEVEMARQIVEREEYILLSLLGEAQKLAKPSLVMPQGNHGKSQANN